MTTLLAPVKNFTRTKPQLYDFLSRWRAPNTDLERWFDDFSRRHDRLRFIQIGASDGLRWDPIRYFVIRDRWRGLFVEPLPRVFTLLKANYAYRASDGLAFANCLIGDQDGSAEIWTMHDVAFLDLLPIEDQLGFQREASMDRNHVIATLARNGYERPETLVKSERVPSLTFNSLIAKHWRHGQIDLVVVDAEGYDDRIVMSIDVEKHRPGAIVFEAHNLTPERRDAVFTWLKQRGYQVTLSRGDAIAVRV